MSNLTGLAQVALTVSDLEASVRFYEDVLGLPFLFKAPPGLAFFQAGPTRLMLTAPQPGDPTVSHAALYYQTPDIQASYEAIRSRGATFAEAPHIIANLGTVDVWLAATHDPDGHLVGLMCETPAKG